MSSLAIVVAQYKEDVSWLAPWAQHVVVYRKGPERENASTNALLALGAQQHIVPNTGREANSYLRYILDHYDTLPDWVVFTQGRVDDHLSLAQFAALLQPTADGRSSNYQRMDPLTRALVFHDKWTLSGQSLWAKGNLASSGMNLGQFFERIVGQRYPTHVRWYTGAIMGVSRERILMRPRADYEAMLATVNTTSDTEAAHFFERAWYYIFQDPRESTNSTTNNSTAIAVAAVVAMLLASLLLVWFLRKSHPSHPSLHASANVGASTGASASTGSSWSRG